MVNKKIQKFLKQVLSDLNYEKIILFGSRARGDFSKRSDYDILVIVERTLSIEEKMKLSTHLRKELARKGIDADIILKSRAEVEYYKNKIGSVVRTALKEGVAV
jgi:predicted nucleotidyltransferase